MKGNNNDIVSYIKEKISIIDVLAKLGGLGLQKSGKEYIGQCPTGHISKSGKSFHVIHDQSNNKNFYFCHNCRENGSPIDLVMLALNLEFPEAISWFRQNFIGLEKFKVPEKNYIKSAQEAELRLQTVLYEILIKKGKELLFSPEGKDALKYLTEERKYREEFIKETELFYLPEEKTAREIIRKSAPEISLSLKSLKLNGHYGDNFRLAFPYRDRQGRITGLIKRATTSLGAGGVTYQGEVFTKQRFDSTGGLNKDDLFGLNRIKNTDTILIVEGYMDAMYLYALGQTNIVAVGTANLSRKHIEGLQKKGINSIIIAFDNDSVGPENTESAVQLLLEETDITPFVLDPGKMDTVKDPDDYVRVHGFEAFQKLLCEVEKGALWLAQRILATTHDGGQLSRDKALSELINLCSICHSPTDQDTIISLISEKLNLKKNVVKEEIKAAIKTKKSIADQNKIDSEGQFWSISGESIDVNIREYVQFLIDEGFAKYYLDKDYVFVKTTDNLVTEKSLPQIKDDVLFFVNSIGDDEFETRELLTEHLYDYVNKYFNEGLIECMPPKEIEFRKDTADTASVYYKNGFVVLCKGIKPALQSYTELGSPIWSHIINDRNISLLEFKDIKAEFEQFLRNVTGRNEDRFRALCSAIGYLMHDYKHDSNAKAVILCDQKISDNPNGRTGKSLIGKAIQKIKNVVRIDGKNFEFKDRFTFQMVNLGTQILDFNDVKADFDFESLFSAITDGMTVEYKNKTPFVIPFAESPKMLISTNYTILGEGASFKDRMYEIEFTDHHNPAHKPKDDFGHDFFNDWDEEEWNRFDNFMLGCLQLYLDEGLLGCALINLSTRKLQDQTSAQFVEFAEENIQEGLEYNLNTLFQEFKAHIGYDNDLFDKCPIKQNTFTKYLPIYAGYKGWEFIKRQSSGRQIVKFVA